jgi:predicted lipoprotein with Yx(FWY)xxD motif
MRNRWLAASVLAAAAVVGLSACGSSGSSSTPSTSSSPKAAASTGSSSSSNMAAGIKTTSISGHTVLTDAQGFTLYWFAIDTPAKSNCNGSCAAYWPPLTGTPSAASGVSLSGKLGTIKRSNGELQATYMGHPLYTYKADTAAGQDSGNGLSLSGGYWWAMTMSGAKIASSSSGSGGSGYSSGSGGSGGGGW